MRITEEKEESNGMIHETLTTNPRDEVVEDENNHIIKWYDNYFLIYGYQKINNRSLSKQNERITFYLNKIAYKSNSFLTKYLSSSLTAFSMAFLIPSVTSMFFPTTSNFIVPPICFYTSIIPHPQI